MHKSVIYLAKKSSRFLKPFACRCSFLPASKEHALSELEWRSFLLCIFIVCTIYCSIAFFVFLGSVMVSVLNSAICSYLIIFGIAFFSGSRNRKRIAEFERNLPAALDLIVSQYRSSGDMVDAIFQVGRSNLRPINSFFRDIAAEIRSGMGYLPAFSKAMRVPSNDLKRVLQLLLLCLEKGANVSNELQHISEDLVEERHLLERKRSIVSKDVLLLCFVFCAIIPFIYALSVSILLLFSSIGGTGKTGEISCLRGLLLFSLPFHGYFISMMAGELIKDDSHKGLVYFPLIGLLPVCAFLLSEAVLAGLYGF